MSQVYLLAAGNGRRAGGPKAWLEHDGKSLLERQMEFLINRFPARNIAVSIQAPWLERCKELNSSARWVAVDAQASPLASLQCLLKLSPLREPGFLYHVDMPVWEPELFDQLEASLRGSE